MMSPTPAVPALPEVGLFLGAGASYEWGMPLTWPLTYELLAWLTPEKLRELNELWHAQGGALADEVLEDAMRLLRRTDMHFEALLGYLQTQAWRPQFQKYRRDYHMLYGKLAEIVYLLLYSRYKSVLFLTRSLRYYEGIAGLAARNTPLWIFSLNYDMLIESVAAHHSIPINCGFTGTTTLIRRDKFGTQIGELEADIITEEQFQKEGLSYLHPGTSGINLLKIHGSLDMFAMQDKKVFLKLRPLGPGIRGVLESMRAAYEELRPTDPGMLHIINEIAYTDEHGVVQFLRRSLIAGAYKYDQRHEQVISESFLNAFKSGINHVRALICIGYGFGDLHINGILRNWLEFEPDRKLVLVSTDPAIPPSLLHVAPQVKLVKQTATAYLGQYARPLTEDERRAKALHDAEIRWVDEEKRTTALTARAT